MGSREVDIRLVVKDDGTIQLNQAGKRIDQFSKKGKSSLDSLTSAYNDIYKKIVTLGGVIVFADALQGVANMGKLGAEVKNVTSAFTRIDNSTELLSRLRTATKGGISDLELMRNALVGIDLGATNQQLETFARFARFESVRKGSDELETFMNILSGVLRGSTELLDNFGISLTDLNSRIVTMAESAGKSVTKLSDVERRQLAVAAATQIMKERLDKLGDSPVTDAEKINQAGVAWENLKDQVSTLASPSIAAGLGKVAEWLDGINQSLNLIRSVNELEDLVEKANQLRTTGGGKGKGGGGGGVDGDEVIAKKTSPPAIKTTNTKPSPAPNKGGTNGAPPPPPKPNNGPSKKEPEKSWTYGPNGWVEWKDLGLGWQDEGKTGKNKVSRTFEILPGGPVPRQRQIGTKPELPLVDKMDEIGDNFEVTFSEMEKFALEMTKNVGDAFMNLGGQIGDEFNGLWTSMFNEGKTVFDRMAISFLSSMTDALSEMAAKWAAFKIMDFILPGAGTLLGSLFGRATGGPVVAQQPYIVGERGPEVFIPQASGRIIPQVSFADTIHVDGFLPDEMMAALKAKRSIQRDELIRMLKELKSINRMPS